MLFMFDQGRFVEETLPTVNVRNKGLNYGLGCIDGIRAFWNEEHRQLYVFRLADHIDRFYKSGKLLFLPIPYAVPEMIAIVRKLLVLNHVKQDVYIRPLCFHGADMLRPDIAGVNNRVAVFTSYLEYEPKPVLRACVSSWNRIGSNMIPPQAKPTAGYLNSALAVSQALADGYDEAIFLTKDGNVSEGATENIFVVQGDCVWTPPVADDILPGITRATVMEILWKEMGIKVKEQSLARAELYRADEVFFTGTAIGIKPVVEVDRRRVGTGEPGSITLAVQRMYEAVVRNDMPGYDHYCTPIYL
ncbi:branched-chain amino acid transaminase [Bacillus sp. SB49]|uniref:branched-chain amino acid transaminase n=1 Tax=Bacillaceae TaxID=186817 RepID=UPI0002A51224|nr:MULTISPECIES: branched-chain amino acid transaminase [Bacillaceae]ELK48089.1 branched-chain amino acid aminotransferase [Halobacillus sp. BAB-2008]QHT45609.1 branched-chain amino acid transaminase [Bacillus sp. SB49]